MLLIKIMVDAEKLNTSWVVNFGWERPFVNILGDFYFPLRDYHTFGTYLP